MDLLDDLRLRDGKHVVVALHQDMVVLRGRRSVSNSERSDIRPPISNIDPLGTSQVRD